MPLMTIAQVREHYNTDAADDAIQRFLDAEEAAITKLLGSVVSVTENLIYPPKNLVLKQEVVSITSVTEDTILLTSDEYELDDNNRVIYRKGWIYDRSYIPWGDNVTIIYVPYDDTAERIRVLSYLMGINLAQNGYRIERNTELLQEPLDYQRERVKALRSLKRVPTIA